MVQIAFTLLGFIGVLGVLGRKLDSFFTGFRLISRKARNCVLRGVLNTNDKTIIYLMWKLEYQNDDCGDICDDICDEK